MAPLGPVTSTVGVNTVLGQPPKWLGDSPLGARLLAARLTSTSSAPAALRLPPLHSATRSPRPLATSCSAGGAHHATPRARRGNTAGGSATAGESASAGTNGSTGGSSSSSSSSIPSPFAFVGLDYYQILAVPVGAPPAEIRRAYRALQKKYHPDVAGAEAHEMALKLNEAYDTLMDDRRRAAYEKEWRDAAVAGYVGFTGQARSAWAAPEGQQQAIFVDEAACIGCRECVFAASCTFHFDSEAAVARVHTQWGDALPAVQSAIDSCPVSCIHTVPRVDLPILEFLVQPRERESKGIFGGGWEPGHPLNIFVAAREFKRKLESQQEGAERRRAATSAAEQETPAQRAARQAADARMNGLGGGFWQKWAQAWGAWGGPGGEAGADGQGGSTQWGQASAASSDASSSGCRREAGRGRGERGRKEGGGGGKEGWFPWQAMLGTAASSEILRQRANDGDREELIAFIQQWATLWSFSSELPLPLPIRVDNQSNGTELTLVTMRGDLLSSVGSFVITVEPLDAAASGDGGDGGDGGVEGAGEMEWVVVVRRRGAIDNRSLPGEGTIVKALRGALERHDSMKGYEAYHLPRNSRPE
ncbi:hypothetical protein CLOM_g23048 [Closterium sp. NIES-68]|nr:hypothetical protein CLOM_g23048 [Closterium sp. NIES-68]GJP78289.1 hypothetical protein CLOP_g8613 [Closterium sp. NIES-67]